MCVCWGVGEKIARPWKRRKAFKCQVREAQEPRRVVEMVLREVRAFDTQLAKLLGDPRKPKTGAKSHRNRRQ